MKKNIAVPLFEKNKLEVMSEILEAFNIECQSISLDENTYIDNYNLILNPGTKASRVERALLDIGLALKAQSSPRGYPVLKEGVYRIEIQKRELDSQPFLALHKNNNKMYAPITLGTDASGEIFQIDLHHLPNLLIGGIPGSGKSVLLHGLILSLINSGAKLYLVDPKMVEFNIYDDISNVKALQNTVEGMYEVIDSVRNIMNSRFEKLSRYKCRNIHEYNLKVKSNKRMCPVVVFVDEWADIILQDKAIQKPLCVIAQKGRAAGISVVLATQRPSANVISGLIKANFSGRIALRVASKIDSRIILDEAGAETISDVGVGLYLDHRTTEPKLFRAPYIKDPAKVLQKLVKQLPQQTFWQRLWQ